jgi:adhesin/invasin
VTVKTGGGVLVVNDPVMASVSGGPTCGTLSPISTTTNPLGQATLAYTASITPGACTISVIEAQSGSGNSLAITQTAVANLVKVTANPARVPADGVTTSTVTVMVMSGATGAAVANDLVVLTLAAGGPLPTCGTLSASSGTTNAAGLLSVTYTSSTTVGFCGVIATEPATVGQGASTITQTLNPPPPVPDTVTLAANPSSITADGLSTSTVTATVMSGPVTVGGDPVMFRLNGPACGTLKSAMPSTDALGHATVTYTASTSVGFCNIVATEAMSASSASTTMTQHL